MLLVLVVVLDSLLSFCFFCALFPSSFSLSFCHLFSRLSLLFSLAFVGVVLVRFGGAFM